MTRKHFEAAAAMVKDFAAKHNLPTEAHEDLAKTFAEFCQKFNSNFDRHRFLKACGVDGVASNSSFWHET